MVIYLKLILNSLTLLISFTLPFLNDKNYSDSSTVKMLYLSIIKQFWHEVSTKEGERRKPVPDKERS
jgi:hypothetical protein